MIMACRDGRGMCLLCQQHLEPTTEDYSSAGAGETAGSLKCLFNYFNIYLEDPVEGGNWADGIASNICGECAFLANAFGGKYKEFENPLRFLRQCIQKLESRRRWRQSNDNPDTTPPSPLPHRLHEILKQYEPRPINDQPSSAQEENPKDVVGDENGNNNNVGGDQEGNVREHQLASTTQDQDGVRKDSGDRTNANIMNETGREQEGEHRRPSPYLLSTVDNNPTSTGSRAHNTCAEVASERNDNRFEETNSTASESSKPCSLLIQIDLERLPRSRHLLQSARLGGDDGEDDDDMEDRATVDLNDIRNGVKDSSVISDSEIVNVPEGPPEVAELMLDTSRNICCRYCRMPMIGPLRDLEWHVMCHHTVRHYADQGNHIIGGATDQGVDQVIRDIVQEGLLLSDDPGNEGIFYCSLCCQEVAAGDKKYHLLEYHTAVVESRLTNERVGVEVEEDSQLIVPVRREAIAQFMQLAEEPTAAAAPPTAPPTPADDVVEVPTSVTAQMRQHQKVKSHFRRNRELYRTSGEQPPYTYAFLIRQAIVESPLKQLSKNGIVDWLKRNFRFFQKAPESVWNSIGSTLSMKKCFQRVKRVGGRRGAGAGVWVIKDREFYKAQTKWAHKTKTKGQGGRMDVATTGVVNVKVEMGMMNQGEPQPASSRNPAHSLSHAGGPGKTIQDADGGPGVPGSRNTGSRRTSAASSLRSLKCHYCVSTFPCRWKLGRHLTCVHTTEHFSTQFRPGTTQDGVNQAVRQICDESTTCSSSSSEKPGSFHCSLCGQARGGDKKYHILQSHMSSVLARLEGGDVRRSVVLPIPTTSNNSSEELPGSSLLLPPGVSVKQEKIISVKQEKRSE